MRIKELEPGRFAGRADVRSMKAIAFSSYGPPEVLQAIDMEAPQAGFGQVRVRVKAAGVQPVDREVRAGVFAPVMSVRFPRILGNEFSGVVDQVGRGTTGIAVGDEVLGFTLLAAYAELVVVDASQIVPKPPRMPWEAAGVLSASGQTAYSALRELRLTAGETIVVHAAAGGIGSFAVQLARAMGAEVLGVAKPEDHEYVRSLGATPVAEGEGLVDRVRALAARGVHAVLDGAGGESLRASLDLCADRDRIGTVVDRETARALGVRALRARRSKSQLTELVELYTQGKLRDPVWKAFPLGDAARAHREVETGHVRGEVVLTIAA